MYLGAILAILLAAAVFVAGKWLASSMRERISLSFMFGGAACVCVGGFLIDLALGYLLVGALGIGFALLLGYESNE